MALPRRRRSTLLIGSGVALAVALLLAPTVGSTSVSMQRVWADPFDWGNNPDAAVFFVARLPRVLLACMVGGTLALAGATFQSLLRNPLASPYTLGVTAGTTLAAFLAIRFSPGPAFAEFSVPVLALAGALATTALLLLLTSRRGDLPPTVLLLAGVTLNFTISAGVLLLQYFSDHAETARMIRWLMGDLDAATYRMLLLLALASLPGWLALLGKGRALNLLSLGADEARAQGVSAASATRSGLLWASWVTGLAVAVAGPVGFVGILVPHAVRLLGGHDYRIVLPASMLGGAAFLITCDTVARVLLAPVELPVGILTASLGGPFFLVLLLSRRVRHA